MQKDFNHNFNNKTWKKNVTSLWEYRKGKIERIDNKITSTEGGKTQNN